jgi:hypothetical protein
MENNINILGGLQGAQWVVLAKPVENKECHGLVPLTIFPLFRRTSNLEVTVDV